MKAIQRTQRTIFTDRQWQTLDPFLEANITVRDDRQPPSYTGIQPEMTPRIAAIRHYQEVMVMMTLEGISMMRTSMEVNPKKGGGVPVFAGTRFPIASLIQEISVHPVLEDMADNYDLNEEDIRNFFGALAILFSRPFVR